MMIQLILLDENIIDLQSLESELENEFDWRQNQISMVKRISRLSNLSQDQLDLIMKNNVIGLYSLWEGFVIEAFSLYIRTINNLNLHHTRLCIPLITHHLYNKFRINENIRTNFLKQCDFIESFTTELSNETINISISSKKNINLKILNSILQLFNISEINSNELNKGLDKLLKYRNSFAHGQYTMQITATIVDEFSYIITNAMAEVINKIVESAKNKSFLR